MESTSMRLNRKMSASPYRAVRVGRKGKGHPARRDHSPRHPSESGVKGAIESTLCGMPGGIALPIQQLGVLDWIDVTQRD